MVKKIKKEELILYQCGECGFHYENEEIAEKCEAWCKKHRSCNIEIIKEAMENKS